MADTTTSVGSSEDLCPNDPEKTAPGACGCGVPDSEAGKTCTTGQPGICSAGITVCANGTRSCQQNLQPRVEVCDGLDNNCSGAVDEGNPGGGAACSTGLLGVCSAGTQTCTNGVLGCRQTTQPSAELCTDSLDNKLRRHGKRGLRVSVRDQCHCPRHCEPWRLPPSPRHRSLCPAAHTQKYWPKCHRWSSRSGD